LVKQKTPRPEPERSPIKVSKGPKIEARDAREVAKKLLKSGAISPIVKTPKRPENEGFKRPARFRGLDRKPTEEKAVPSYQPFSASPADETDDVKQPFFTPKIKVYHDSSSGIANKYSLVPTFISFCFSEFVRQLRVGEITGQN